MLNSIEEDIYITWTYIAATRKDMKQTPLTSRLLSNVRDDNKNIYNDNEKTMVIVIMFMMVMTMIKIILIKMTMMSMAMAIFMMTTIVMMIKK